MTTLVRLPAFPQFNQLHEEVNRLLDGAFRTANSAVSEWVPRTDIYETEQGLTMQFDLPGLRQEDLEIHIENDTLTIKGERKLATEPEKYLRVERRHGAFTRVFSLPDFVDQAKIEANLVDGVLTLTLPRREETRPRQIQVQVQTPQTA
jgi:HSP20 family protein